VRRVTLACAAATCAAALAFPAIGASTPNVNSKSAIAKQCAAEKKADKAAFRATYGKHAMRNCIKGEVATVDPVVTPTVEPTNPAQTCDELRNGDSAGFAGTYGTNHPSANSNGGGRNAYGQCVSSTAHSSHGGGPPA
jgi:hypothetical protein